MIAADRRLQVLHALLRRAEGDDVARVQDAIRRHQRALEREQGDLERLTVFGPAPSAGTTGTPDSGARANGYRR